jgi:hypothetical protein
MVDVLFVLAAIAFFGIAVAFTAFCDRLLKSDGDPDQPGLNEGR